MTRLKDKVALITGAAGGIGLATVRRFLDEGAAVMATDLPAAPAQSLQKLLESHTQLRYISHDVTRPEAWQAACNGCQEAFGGFDILVNNAGIALREKLGEMNFQTWRQVLDVNLDGVFLGVQAAVDSMRANGTRAGSIINLSSIMGIVGGAGPAYNASKGGVRLLTKSVAASCAREELPIRVNSVHPGYIRTNMIENAFQQVTPEADGMTPDEVREMIRGLHPMGRFGEPEEIANGILFLASDESSFMTGSELVIDGGYTAV